MRVSVMPGNGEDHLVGGTMKNMYRTVLKRLATSAFYAGFGVASLAVVSASAQPKAADTSPVRIGVLTDMSGLFADISGPGALVAVNMAVDDFGGKGVCRPNEGVSADHQNKADIGVAPFRGGGDEEKGGVVAALIEFAG